MKTSKYIMILVFFILGCIASSGISQDRTYKDDIEQRKKVAEQVRRYRQKTIESKQGPLPPPKMERGYEYLRPERPRPDYYRHRGMHPNVGYRPYIVWLPEGAIMGVRGQVTPDRRRVIIGGNFGFYGIQGVNTFNFRTGEYR
jgi:hypothetical protein